MVACGGSDGGSSNSTGGNSTPRGKQKLVVAIQPTQASTEMLQKARPLEEYLEKTIGNVDVEIYVPLSQSGVIEALRFGHACRERGTVAAARLAQPRLDASQLLSGLHPRTQPQQTRRGEATAGRRGHNRLSARERLDDRRYAEAAAKLFFQGDLRDPSLSVATDDGSLDDAYFALVTNTTPWTYAGAFPLQPTPDSRFELGLDAFALTKPSHALGDVAVVQDMHTGWVLSQMFLPKGLPARGDGYVTWHDQSSLRISSTHPRAFQIDGEYLGEREEVNFHSVPKALRIFC